MFLCTKRGLLTRQFQAFSSYMAAPIAPLQCHILYIQPEFLVQILNLAKQHNSSRTDRYSIIYVPVDLAITIAQSQPHQSVLSCELSRLGNRMFFSKKIRGGHRNVQEFSKLTLFLNFDFFFCFKKYHFMLPTFLERALLLPNDALDQTQTTLPHLTFDPTLLSVFVR